LQVSLRYQPIVLVVFFVTLLATIWLLFVTPKGFFPQEDIGQLSVSTEARQDISFDAMVALQQRAAEVIRGSPHVANVASIIGSSGQSSGLNTGRMFVELKGRKQRPELQRVLSDLRTAVARIPGINAYATPVQNLRIGGRSSRAEFQFVMQSLDRDQLYEWSQKMADAMGRDSRFTDVNSDLQVNATQATLVIDKDKANSLGISAEKLRSTLYSGFGSRQVSTIYKTGDTFSVIMEFTDKANWTPAILPDVRIRNASGKLVPIGTFARVERTAGSLTINQLGQLPAITISFNLPRDISLGDAVARIDQLKAELGLPRGITTTYSGSAKTYQDSLANQGILLIAAVVTIYIVLGILYESYIHPFTILTGLPSAVVGALLALRLFGMDLSLIAVIGLLMLIGIVKKNAIMMIDVALTTQREGKPARAAIYEAALLRFRPIMMTTMAALLGVLPIAIGAGAGAELRQPLGVAVVGGLLVSQVLTLYMTPVLYIYLEDLARATHAWRAQVFKRRSRQRG
jgi:hydrophobic/amphiphilic exporter-1 (mainly G- bacteria), HAE1 family